MFEQTEENRITGSTAATGNAFPVENMEKHIRIHNSINCMQTLENQLANLIIRAGGRLAEPCEVSPQEKRPEPTLNEVLMCSADRITANLEILHKQVEELEQLLF